MMSDETPLRSGDRTCAERKSRALGVGVLCWAASLQLHAGIAGLHYSSLLLQAWKVSTD